MKLLLLFVFCIFSFFAQAQNSGAPGTPKQPEVLKKFKGTNGDELRKQFEAYFKHQFQNVLLGSKQGRIAILPQDHMPCLVPDTSAIAPMPNAWKAVSIPYRSQHHPIPNPALPQQSLRYNLADQWKEHVK